MAQTLSMYSDEQARISSEMNQLIRQQRDQHNGRGKRHAPRESGLYDYDDKAAWDHVWEQRVKDRRHKTQDDSARATSQRFRRDPLSKMLPETDKKFVSSTLKHQSASC